jgi:hypothetical protein
MLLSSCLIGLAVISPAYFMLLYMSSMMPYGKISTDVTCIILQITLKCRVQSKNNDELRV